LAEWEKREGTGEGNTGPENAARGRGLPEWEKRERERYRGGKPKRVSERERKERYKTTTFTRSSPPI
jgi:hypothetical protein